MRFIYPHCVLLGLVLLAAALVPALGRAAAGGSAPARTNVVLILADDLGWGDLGGIGQGKVPTPNLSRLASEGARFTQFYAPVPYCAPSRAALLTGRYPPRCGLTQNPFPSGDPQVKNLDDVGLPLAERTLADLLGGAGYRSACYGKWHLGHQPRFRPTRRGFHEYFGVLYSNDMHPVELFDGERMVEYPVVQATLTRRLTERAVAFIERNRERPFFLYLPHAMPHKPLAVSESFYGKSGAGLYGDVLTELDWSIGELLGTLKRLDLERNTLILFTSDNGPWYGGSTGGLRGMKGQTWEGGIRVPLLARLPGRIVAGQPCDAIGTLADLFPTALAAAGVKAPAGRVLDGIDLLPVLTSGARPTRDALFFWRADRLAAVRSGKWKLHLAAPGPARDRIWKPDEPWVDPRRPDGVRILAPYEQAHPSQFPGLQTGDPGVAGALFDLAADPAEQRNVAAQHPKIVRELTGRALAFERSL